MTSLLTLYKAGPLGEVMGGSSPYVYKVDLWLRMAGIEYREVIAPPMKLLLDAPRGLIPFVDLNGERIGDSSLIIDQLKDSFDDPLDDQRLTQEQVEKGELLKALCEYEFFEVIFYGRFHEDSDSASITYYNWGGAPEDQAQAEETLNRSLSLAKEKLHTLQIGRYDLEFVNAKLRKCLGILSSALRDSKWLFGDTPSSYDAVVFAFLASVIHYPFKNQQVAISREYTNLVRYCDRIKNSYY